MAERLGSQYNPFRLDADVEEYFTRGSEPYVGVTGTLFPGEEATVVISGPDREWHHMDVDYAIRIATMLVEIIGNARKHNAELGL